MGGGSKSMPSSATIGCIDASDRRQAFGSFDTCLAKLNEVKKAENFPPNPKK